MKALDLLVEIDEHGKIVSDHHRNIIMARLLQYAGKLARIRITKEQRTEAQNRLLWRMYGRIMPACIEAGEEVTSEILHEFFKKVLIPGECSTVDGVEIILRSTAKMDKSEFSEYVENIRSHRYVIERGVVFDDYEIEQWMEQVYRPKKG